MAEGGVLGGGVAADARKAASGVRADRAGVNDVLRAGHGGEEGTGSSAERVSQRAARGDDGAAAA